MTKKLIIISALLLTAIFLSCNSGKKTKKEVAQPGDATVFGIYTNKDSTKTAAILFRRIIKTIAYDSVKRREYITVDSIYGYPKFLNLPLKDSSGVVLKDSTGNPVIDPRPTYFLISKDSVRVKGIEGVPMDSLLRKNAPIKG